MTKLRHSLFIPLAFCGLTTFGSAPEYQPDADTRYYAYIVETDGSGEDAVSQLESRGVRILRQRGNFLLCYVPETYFSANTAAGLPRRAPEHSLPGVLRMERSRTHVPAMDKARTWADAGLVLTGEGLPQAYDGRGVVVGMTDIGFDSRHPAFLTDDGTECRVRKVVHYQESNGGRLEYVTPQAIYDWHTDSEENWHGTHVANILAGGRHLNPYYGMAPGADLVATVSELTDVGLLSGAEDILEYAKEQGKPCVISMSVGSYVGPHDGTSLFCRYLDLIAEEAPVFIATGNEGAVNNCMRFTFTEEKPSFQFQYSDAKWTFYNMEGTIELWNNDDSPLKLGFRLYDMDRKQDYILPEADFNETGFWAVTSDASSPYYNADFAKVYTGALQAEGYVDDINHRFCARLAVQADTEMSQSGKGWARYVIIPTVYGAPGVHTEVFADGSRCNLRKMGNGPAADNLMSVSDLATGHNIISVGMYNSRGTYPRLDGGEQTFDGIPGDINVNSSYGTLHDGRVTPMTSAPGFPILSAFSSGFTGLTASDISTMSHSAEHNGTTYYWRSEGGTSMSTPYTAGCAATWLQMKPDLTPADIRKLIAETNEIADVTNPSDPRYGQGMLRPYAIAKRIIGEMSVASWAESEGHSLSYQDGTLKIQSNTPAELRVFSPDGRLEYSRKLRAGVTETDLRFLPAGIHIARSANQTLKIRK